MAKPPLSYFTKMEMLAARSGQDYGRCEKIVSEAFEKEELSRVRAAADDAIADEDEPKLRGAWPAI